MAEPQVICFLASLEFPPYTGVSLREQGISAAMVRAAFAAMGYLLEMKFYSEERNLHVCFQRSSEGARECDILNAGLKKSTSLP
jgi:hypothetical protein